ncbi:hypothetical protein ASAP_2863 [Asaia bogorensis]|uniref:Uncharacterized protein n=1 Tax=Asaia bogorensis TaxID=91915 RepID=A0A060QJN1_9PROT|nr:hypothetical protein ASAP_2863 [Asaia bogorensis]
MQPPDLHRGARALPDALSDGGNGRVPVGADPHDSALSFGFVIQGPRR